MGYIAEIVKKKYKLILPVLYFLLTFVWERKLFIYTFEWDLPNMPVEKAGSYISRYGECRIVYVLTKLICFILIWMFCKIILSAIELRKSDSHDVIRVLCLVYVGGLLTGFILYPEVFGAIYAGIDNYSNYAMAIRFIPTYWQSIYTGALYAASLMVIPHPISVLIVQWTMCVAAVAYVCVNLEKLYPGSRIRYLPLFLLVLPEAYYLAFDPYRNNYFTVLLIFYISFLYFKSRSVDVFSLEDNIVFILGTAFLMVWRSEGIIVGLGALSIYVANSVRKGDRSLKKHVIILVAVAVAFFVLKKPQDIGNEKYYGRDYFLLNTTGVLSNILNDPNSDLSYEVSGKNLDAINDLIPLEILKEYGMEGFRAYNWSLGHKDFNQTLAVERTADSYMDAYYNIILHNPQQYLNVQINNAYRSLQLKQSRPVYSYEDEHQTEFENYDYSMWKTGLGEVGNSFLTGKWSDCKLRRILYVLVSEAIRVWRELIVNSGINPLIHSFAIIMDVLILIYEFLQMLRDRKRNPVFLMAFAVILAETLAIVLFMPVAREAYMYPMLFSSYLMIFYYFLPVKRKEGDNII